MKNPTKVERKSDRELVVTRTINGPARMVFEAWSKPELFTKWWVPKGAPITLKSCELDVRTGGSYRLVFGFVSQPGEMAVFGKYLDVVPNQRMVWTNEEGGEGTTVISTLTFEERDGKTLLTLHDLYPSKDALEAAIASGSTEGTPAQWSQLDEFISAQLR